MSIVSAAVRAAQRLSRNRLLIKLSHPDYPPELHDIIARVLPYTMTSPARIAALYDAVRYVEARRVPGAFVECGVWKGGSTMVAALTFRTPRPLFLYDTFAGMTNPTDEDRRALDGRSAKNLMKSGAKDIIACANLDEVKHNLASTGYPSDMLYYIKGPVEQTIPAKLPESISVLRLDTDWYSSTIHELRFLFPLLSPGGVLIIDDYGWWEGAKRAVDEYFGSSVYLSRIDKTGRTIVKTFE